MELVMKGRRAIMPGPLTLGGDSEEKGDDVRRHRGVNRLSHDLGISDFS